MGRVDAVNDQLLENLGKEVSRRETEINRHESEIRAYETTNSNLQTDIDSYNSKNRYLEHSINEYTNEESFLYTETEEKKEKQVKIKENIRKLTLSKFLETIDFYRSTDKTSNIFYKGVLINSFYELEFHFPNATDFNNILRCRCVSIGTPNIRKNYTSLNFNGRRVEIEQNAEFQHDIQLRIICDDEADIYYTFKEYIDFNETKKPNRIFNNSKIYICLNGFKTIELNHITISDLGQLEFDNGPNSNICFFNVTLKIIDYKFFDIKKQNEYDKLTFEILKNNTRIETIENKIKTAQTQIDENSRKIKNTENSIRENNETIKHKKGEIEFLRSELAAYF